MRETLTPKSKKIAELKDENRGLKRSLSKILSFSERLMDENDVLIDYQAALEYEYFSTVEHMHTITTILLVELQNVNMKGMPLSKISKVCKSSSMSN